MFPDKGQSFNGLKHLTESVTAVASQTRVRVVVDHTMPTPLQSWTKLKISHWYFLISVFTPSRLHLLSKTSWTSILTRTFFSLTSMIHLMRCLSSMVNLIAVTTLLLTSGLHCCYQRICKKNTNYFYAVRIGISLAILSEVLTQIDYFF